MASQKMLGVFLCCLYLVSNISLVSASRRLDAGTTGSFSWHKNAVEASDSTSRQNVTSDACYNLHMKKVERSLYDESEEAECKQLQGCKMIAQCRRPSRLEISQSLGLGSMWESRQEHAAIMELWSSVTCGMYSGMSSCEASSSGMCQWTAGCASASVDEVCRSASLNACQEPKDHVTGLSLCTLMESGSPSCIPTDQACAAMGSDLSFGCGTLRDSVTGQTPCRANSDTGACELRTTIIRQPPPPLLTAS